MKKKISLSVHFISLFSFSKKNLSLIFFERNKFSFLTEKIFFVSEKKKKKKVSLLGKKIKEEK